MEEESLLGKLGTRSSPAQPGTGILEGLERLPEEKEETACIYLFVCLFREQLCSRKLFPAPWCSMLGPPDTRGDSLCLILSPKIVFLSLSCEGSARFSPCGCAGLWRGSCCRQCQAEQSSGISWLFLPFLRSVCSVCSQGAGPEGGAAAGETQSTVQRFPLNYLQSLAEALLMGRKAVFAV